ncbi:MAG: PKD domain-containing protein [Saprospiraceae bacterium]|nr:PKD domain-containing protein [Saprospiraceae bacterium]
MRKLYLLITISLLPLLLPAQNANDAKQSVIIQAEIQESPPRITLNWVADPQNSGYTIHRKAKTANGWGSSIGSALPTGTTWTDTNVVVGQAYEYRVQKSLANYGGGASNGYIYAGIKVPATVSSGACLLVIDSTFKVSLASEIARLQADIAREGWQVSTLYVDRNDPVTLVKTGIKSWSNTTLASNKTVFLLGHVPVPYSGFIAPDGHVPDHQGAWPADGYYAELDGVWTDQSVNTEVPNDPRNDNIPGDGKFDQSIFPTKVELQVGRVDFANMPTFAQSEEALLRRYLDKDHAWRTGMVQAEERGLIQNNFAGFPEGFGQNGWKNFSTMFGYENTAELPYRATLLNDSYLWSYGCGAGSYTSASGITTTNDLVNDSLKTVFTMLFGSYFGDWDRSNNLLRAAIASGATLTNAWAARPNWMFHHMAMGEHIGFAAQVAMNNNGSTYQSGNSPSSIHVALMGDPTLRMYVKRPVQDLTATQDGLHVALAWTDANASMGYLVFKKKANEAEYFQLTPDPITTTAFVDSCSGQGLTDYMVRAVELRETASGSFYNLSQGVDVQIDIDQSGLAAAAAYVAVPYFDEVSFDNASSNAIGYEWDFGDGTSSDEESPVHFYAQPGTYTVCLNAFDACAGNLHCDQVTVTNSLPTIEAQIQDALCFGTPTGSIVLNATGGTPMLTISWDNAPDTDLQLADLPAGDYTCTIVSETGKVGTYGPYTIGQNPELLVDATSTPADPGQSNGTITLAVSGGCQPYSYAWSNGMTDPGPPDLPAGDYCVTITDCNGCTTDTCVTILETSAIDQLPGLITATITPNPATDLAQLALTFASSQRVTCTVMDGLGRPILQQFGQGTRMTIDLDLGTLPTGRYWIQIRSEQGTGMMALDKVD